MTSPSGSDARDIPAPASKSRQSQDIDPFSEVTSSAASATDSTAVAAREAIIRAAEGAVSRYRVMAYVTGVMLLLLVLEMVLVYLVKVDADVQRLMVWIPIAHGWIYVLYLVTVVDLWSKMRWNVGRLAQMVLGGVVPVMSFVVEKFVRADACERIGAAREL